MLLLLLSVLFHLQDRVSFLKTLIFRQDILGNVHYVPGKGTLIKAFDLPNKTKQRI